MLHCKCSKYSLKKKRCGESTCSPSALFDFSPEHLGHRPNTHRSRNPLSCQAHHSEKAMQITVCRARKDNAANISAMFPFYRQTSRTSMNCRTLAIKSKHLLLQVPSSAILFRYESDPKSKTSELFVFHYYLWISSVLYAEDACFKEVYRDVKQGNRKV